MLNDCTELYQAVEMCKQEEHTHKRRYKVLYYQLGILDTETNRFVWLSDLRSDELQYVALLGLRAAETKKI